VSTGADEIDWAKIEARALEWERENAERRERESVEAEKRRLEHALSRVPRKVRRVLEGELAQTGALAAAESFDGEILVLSGPPGCGKTVAAGRWFVQQYDGGGEFITASQLERVGRYGEELDKLGSVRCLVIDDLGNEYLDQKGSFASLLDGLINERYSNERGTVIATNLSAEEFKQRYGERIADRIRGAGRFVSINEPSLRRKEGQQ
jgi:DNA replication protein DnaC